MDSGGHIRYPVEIIHLASDHRRIHFWTPCGAEAAGGAGGIASGPVASREVCRSEQDFSAPPALVTTFYTYPEPGPIWLPPRPKKGAPPDAPSPCPGSAPRRSRRRPSRRSSRPEPPRPASGCGNSAANSLARGALTTGADRRHPSGQAEAARSPQELRRARRVYLEPGDLFGGHPLSGVL